MAIAFFAKTFAKLELKTGVHLLLLTFFRSLKKLQCQSSLELGGFHCVQQAVHKAYYEQ